MAWIDTIDEDDAEGELAALYRGVLDPATARVDNVLKVHSLDPGGLGAHVAVYRSAMRGTRGLPKAEREMIALVVSALNDCHY